MSGGVTNSYAGGRDAASLLVLADDLAKVPAAVRRRLGPAIKAAGQETLQEATWAAAQWSSRIPRALSLRASTGSRSPGVMVVADTTAAPHARVYEGIVADTFRHPVFGIKEAEWVTERARPYLRPAARKTGGIVIELVRRAVDQALADSGL